ncbi:hypothetical protein BJ322DRAFT_407336 [Thelephora terrestris]|uniref:BHLH domain-containing protein n=1 Tax=Thelephora terrestris TaxID=56493 RepID=A0A9P6LB13_9AGAM|nr:hypothetical protein BJ322DRAFT_407336 [Thelephora terrestris]
MSLLTPTEAVTFQAFLASVDYTESYNGPTPAEWMLLHHGVRHPDDPKPSYPEAPKLKKATLDLMALDVSDANGLPTGAWQRSSPHSKQLHPYPIQADRSVPSDRSTLLIENVRQIYPPHSSSSNSPPPEGTNLSSPYPSSSALRPSSGRLSTRSSSKRSFDTVSPAAAGQSLASIPYLPTTQRAKRSRQSSSPHQRASDPSQSSTPSSSSSRQLAQAQEGTSSSSRSQLLSASQKRANHIQSEQKRRANIRRGYEALCETVPALREAIRKEEEEVAVTLVGPGNSSSRNTTRKKKAKNANDDGEKIDGRAGPRSENIVLQKTIDYIQELNATKEDLLRRLAQVRSVLPLDHPLLSPQGISNPDTGEAAPLWEREWNYSPDADDEGSEDETS